MSNLTYSGTATTRALVRTLTLGGTWEADDVINLTLTDESGATVATLQVISGSTTIATICTTIATNWNASTDAYLSAITALAGATTVTFTADTAGLPFYLGVTTTETGGGGADLQTATMSTTTANKSPKDLWTLANYAGGVAPAASDNLYIDQTAADTIEYGLYQNTELTLNSSITLASLNIARGHKQIATLAAPLTIKYSVLDYGLAQADGSSSASATICNLKPGNVAVVGTIRSTRDVGSSGKPPLQISVANASAAFTVQGESKVGFGTAVNGETCTCGTITTKDKAQVTCGSGLTLTTLNPEGGVTTLFAGMTTAAYGKGAVIVRGSGNITTATVGGDFQWESSGTITNLHVDGAGVFHWRGGIVSNGFIYGSASRITCDGGTPPTASNFPAGVDVLRGAESDQVNFGDNVTVSPSAP